MKISTILITVAIQMSLMSAYNCYTMSCRDESSYILDWFVLYKLPRDPYNSLQDKNIMDGTGYARMTNKKEDFDLSQYSFNESRSLAARTLDILYENDYTSSTNNIGYIMYSDQSPIEGVSRSSSRAHAKGVIGFDDKQLFWLVHSIPEFPPPVYTKKFKLDESQAKYGQSMVCMSMSIDELESILVQLMISWPIVYDYHIPESHSKSSLLKSFVKGARIYEPKQFKKTLKTIDGQEFLAIHKSSKYEEDLYSGLLTKYLGPTVFAETWTNGVGTIDSNCSCPTSAYNVNVMKTPYLTFPNSKDHSKLAIVLGADKKPQYLCIGDINRQKSQCSRGGGTICINNKSNLAATYYGFISAVDSCYDKYVELKLEELEIC